jgi:glycosyltransferase involved in cell wall biosynthesis
MKTISAVITAFNSVKTIGSVLESVAWAGEIIVVDTDSTDGTRELCAKYPQCRIIQDPSGLPNVKRNHGYEAASGDWIITLDSDEIISAPLAEEIRAIVASQETRFDGYLASNRDLMFGKWLRYVQGQHARPQRYILFRKGCLRYACKRIHEMPLIQGRWGYLKNWYDHEPQPTDLSALICKMNGYSDKDIQTVNLEEARKRFTWSRMVFSPLKQFLIMYVKHQGFRDGAAGLMISVITSMNVFIENAKLWEFIYVTNTGKHGTFEHSRTLVER